MATVESLSNPRFSLLEPNERFALIRELRFARRTKPAVEKTKNELSPRAKKPSTAKKRKNVLTDELAGMSQEQILMLMELMKNADTD